MRSLFIGLVSALLFIFVNLPLNANAAAMKLQSDFDEELFDDDQFDDFGLDTIESLNEELVTIVEDLEIELEGVSSKPLKVVVARLGRVADSIDKAIEASEEGEADECGTILKRAAKLLKKVTAVFGRKACPEGITSKRCIDNEIVDFFLEDLESLRDQIIDEVSIDDDEDGIPDLCSEFEEEFEGDEFFDDEEDF